MTEPDILILRAAIDELDDKIIALLNERSEIVKRVGMTKKKRAQDGVAFIRAGREANMVRRIHAAFKNGIFPASAATHLWRMIISASLSLESPLTVSAFAPETNLELYWLAREYFGHFTPITKEPTAKRVLGNVLDGKSEVGIMPLADNSPEGSWWPRLPEGIKIFACVPFMLTKGAEIKALAVAHVEPEDTGDDITLVRVETDMDVSQSRLKAAFDKLAFDVRWLAAETFPSGHRAHLIEIKGFMTNENKALIAFKKEIGASILGINILGAYAAPLAV